MRQPCDFGTLSHGILKRHVRLEIAAAVAKHVEGLENDVLLHVSEDRGLAALRVDL